MEQDEGERFEANRAHLRAVAYRMLGSLSEADDAVQETWLRLSQAGAEGVDNLGDRITRLDIIADPDRLSGIEVRE
jgi:Sigma-70 region 2